MLVSKIFSSVSSELKDFRVDLVAEGFKMEDSALYFGFCSHIVVFYLVWLEKDFVIVFLESSLLRVLLREKFFLFTFYEIFRIKLAFLRPYIVDGFSQFVDLFVQIVSFSQLFVFLVPIFLFRNESHPSMNPVLFIFKIILLFQLNLIFSCRFLRPRNDEGA